MARKPPTEEESHRVANYYADLPVREKVALLWGESESALKASPWKPGSGHEIQAYFDMDEWFSGFDICIYFPRGRLRLFRPSTYITLDFIDPSYPEAFLDLVEEPRVPHPADLCQDKAREILREGETHQLVGDALVAIGRLRLGHDIELLEKLTEAPDPVIRYIALGVISWRLDPVADRIIGTAIDDSDKLVRKYARWFTGQDSSYFDDTHHHRDGSELTGRILPCQKKGTSIHK